MSTRTSYPQGTPNWVDLATPDVESAQAFYGPLMGWEFAGNEMPQGGQYLMASLNGKSAAGVMEQRPDQIASGMPAMWNTYIAVDDAAKVCESAEAAGGSVVMPPMQVMDSGDMAVLADPSGAMFGVWQANQHIGCEVVNEDGAVIWNELVSDNIEKAAPFYAEALGVEVTSQDMGGDEPYTLFNVDGRTVAGAMAPQAPGMPNHWMAYFCVEDVDACVAKAQELGGVALAEPFDIPEVGRMAPIADPQGAAFMLMCPANPPQD